MLRSIHGMSVPRLLWPDAAPGTQKSVRFSAKQPSASGQAPYHSLLALTPEQQTFLSTLQRVTSRYDKFAVQQWDQNKTPPLRLLQDLGWTGLFVTGVPFNAQLQSAETLALRDKLGEQGHARSLALAAMAFSKNLGAGTATFLGVNNGLAAETLAKIGTPEQRDYWLNKLNQGVLTYAFGLTEETAGSDPRSMRTTFTPITDETGNITAYKLNGNKKFIGNAASAPGHKGADYIQVFAVDDPDKPPKNRTFHVFMVPRKLIGESNITPSGGEYNKLGMREINNGDIQLKDVIVPAKYLLGEPGKDIYGKLMGLLDETRLFVGAMGLGTTEASLDEAFKYTFQRQQSGVPIHKFQGVMFPLMKLEARLIAGKLLAMNAAGLVDEANRSGGKGPRRNPIGHETAMVKLFGSELAEDATRQAVNTFGGNGYMENPAQSAGLAKRFRNAKVLTIYEGTSNIQRNLISAWAIMDRFLQAKQELRRMNPKALVKLFVLGSPFTKQVAEDLLRREQRRVDKVIHNKEATPRQKIDAAYDYAVSNVLFHYSEKLNWLKLAWAKQPPDDYTGWDDKSIERQQRINASWHAQGRMYVLADIATYKRLADVATQHLNWLAEKQGKTTLSAEERKQQVYLNLFMKIAEETVEQKVDELQGPVLADLEENYFPMIHQLRQEYAPKP